MIDVIAAENIVSDHLARVEQRMNDFGLALPGHADKPRLHLVVTSMTEYDFGWVFVRHQGVHGDGAPKRCLGRQRATDRRSGRRPDLRDRDGASDCSVHRRVPEWGPKACLTSASN